MKPIDRSEILDLPAYEAIRDAFRTKIIAEKRTRRVAVGPQVTAVFESRETALLQIQEMLRTERITRAAAVQHEIDTYNELVPGDAELSITVMIEIPDRTEREAFLARAVGFERHVWLLAGGEQLPARSIDRSAGEEGEAASRTTAVHYMKIALTPAAMAAIRDAGRGGGTSSEIALAVAHPAYAARATLPPATLLTLAEDLQG
jgi:hypothetical protein